MTAAPFSPDMAKALRVASIVAGQHLMPNEAVLFRSTRGGEGEAPARHELAYLLHTACGMSLNRVGQVLRRDRSTISYAVRVVEESLEDFGRAARMERLSALTKEAVAIGALADEAAEKLIAGAKR